MGTFNSVLILASILNSALIYMSHLTSQRAKLQTELGASFNVSNPQHSFMYASHS